MVPLLSSPLLPPPLQTEFDETQHIPADMPLRYGAVIRLWIRDAGSNGGFLGYAARDVRRIKGELPQAGRFNVGMNDTFFVVPPFRSNRGWHFKETYFKVRYDSLTHSRLYHAAFAYISSEYA